MKTQVMLTLVIMVLSATSVYAIDMSGLNLTEDSTQTITRNVEQERVKIIWLQVQMHRIEAQIDLALKQRDKLSDEAREEILSARRAAANARAAGNALALFFGGACAVGQKASGQNDTSASFELTNDLMASNARYSDYSTMSRMQGANATANGLYAQAQSYGVQANDLRVQRQQIQSQLDRCIIEYLAVINSIITNIPGFHESGLGRAKDLAFDPAAGTDKAFHGPLIYSLTFVIEGKPIDVRMTDLEQMIADDFASLIADRKKALEATRVFELDKYVPARKKRLKEIEKALADAKLKKKNTTMFTTKRSAINDEIKRLNGLHFIISKEIKDLEFKGPWDWVARYTGAEMVRTKLAERAKNERAKAKASLEFAKRVKIMMSTFDKEELKQALKQIINMI